jgi:DNA recombination protein RmuC
MEITVIILVSLLLVLEVVKLIFKAVSKESTLVDEVADEINKQLIEENNKLAKEILNINADLRQNLAESIGKNAKEMTKDLNYFKEGLNKEIIHNFEKLNNHIEEQMERINKKVENRLTEGFEKTNKTFTNIVERLSKIDEAQKNIEKLSTEVVSLQDVLTDKKTRGTYGEVQLNNILSSIFGDEKQRDSVYETQKTLSNGMQVDALLHLADPMGDLAIDSKFPLENYQAMIDKNKTDHERTLSERKFKSDVKKHVDDIASKYIIPAETSDQAVMFVPAEAIFAEIHAHHPDLVDYAQRKRVWIASPTTMMSLLTTVQVLLYNAKRDEQAKVIQEELIKLGDEFKRYKERWNKLSSSIDTVTKRVKEIHTTSDKIERRFDTISKVKLEEKDEIEETIDNE